MSNERGEVRERRDLTEIETRIETRIREIFTLVGEHQTSDHEVNKDISNRLVGIETTVNGNAAREVVAQSNEAAWFRRLFWVFAATAIFHVATWIGLTVVGTRVTILNEISIANQLQAQEAQLRTVDRLGRIEGDARARSESDRLQRIAPTSDRSMK